MALRHRRLPSDASALSFAVIYDPENGLQSFTEPVLPAYDEPDSSVHPPERQQVEKNAGLYLDPLDTMTRQPFALFSRRGPEKHILNICTSSLLFENKTGGEETGASSPAQSDFSKSIYSQESGTDETAETYAPKPATERAPTLSQSKTTDLPQPAAKTIPRPKLSFKMPSFYGRVSFYRKKPVKSVSSGTPATPPPQPKLANFDEIVQGECGAGPRLYTLLHKVHNAGCSGASHSAGIGNACCDVGDLPVTRATHQVSTDDTDKQWHPHQTETQDYSAHDYRYDMSAGNIPGTWPAFEYDPRLPSRFSVTTTSTSTYVEIDMDALSFDDSTRYYSAPFDDVPVLEPASPSNSLFGTPKRLRNPWRPVF